MALGKGVEGVLLVEEGVEAGLEIRVSGDLGEGLDVGGGLIELLEGLFELVGLGVVLAEDFFEVVEVDDGWLVSLSGNPYFGIMKGSFGFLLNIIWGDGLSESVLKGLVLS